MGKREADRTKKRLVLLDSHAIIHRAYHALPDFTSAQGEPTGALYGLTSMLLKIMETLQPDYLVACRDVPGPTHRHEVYEAYKGTREKAEDALIAQLERAPEVFAAFGIPLYEAPGFEADDCLATIVRQCAMRDDLEIVIASGDLDALQLVSGSRVQVYTFRVGLNDTVMYDEKAVRERFGFAPELLPDYKGLRGDPSDNIKGVSGIGEKTATQLIAAFGSVEHIYETLHSRPEALAEAGIKPRVIELLRAGERDALFSKQLATMHSEVPILFTLPDSPWNLADHKERIMTLCDTFNFRSLKGKITTLSGVSEQVLSETDAAEATPEHPRLKEASIGLWLLHSDITNPTEDDVLRYTNANTVDDALEIIVKKLRETGDLWRVFEDIERPLIPIVAAMECTGIALNVPYLEELKKEYAGELATIAARVYGHAGREFNINSPKQLAVVLYDELHITPERIKKTAGGARTTREDELRKLRSQHPIVDDVLAYRELQKLLSTYVEPLPSLVGDDGRIHATFLQAGTTTGRMASEQPNLQNIPIRGIYGARIRNAFVAAPGYVLASLDYSQIELRIAAGLSGDEKLVHVFKTGGDIHAAVASEVFNVPPEMVDSEMRRRAKVINFGILYGMGVNALRETLGEGVTRDEASGFLRRYFQDFPGLAHYLELKKAEAAQRGYTETLFGRRRTFAGLSSPLPGVRAQSERMAINAPIQGTAADVIKKAMVDAENMLQTHGYAADARLLLQVHDELVYEVRAERVSEIVPAIARVMESVVKDDGLSGVPLIVSAAVGKNWGEKESFHVH